VPPEGGGGAVVETAHGEPVQVVSISVPGSYPELLEQTGPYEPEIEGSSIL